MLLSTSLYVSYYSSVVAPKICVSDVNSQEVNIYIQMTNMSTLMSFYIYFLVKIFINLNTIFLQRQCNGPLATLSFGHFHYLITRRILK